MSIDRRDFVRSLAALACAGSAGSRAAPSSEFDANIARLPWLEPFKGVGDAEHELRCDALAITGRWPAELRGRFYRNGPALFERGGQRYRHWFDGDGMVQRFTFSGSKVSHLGRLVRTPKLLAEQQAQRFLYPAFGTPIAGEVPLRGPDSMNTANTNAIEHAGRVLALWEGGSAFALDPNDLATQGAVTWRDGLEQVPFSAHPKLDPSGHLWNFGSFGKRIVVWHIDPQGRLVDARLADSPYPGGMVHDMALTARHIVLPLPPVRLDLDAIARGATPEQAFEYRRDEPLRILVMPKDDPAERRVFELPAQMLFHVGNAYERRDGSIALTFVGAPDHRFLVRGAVALLRGEIDAGDASAGGASSTQSALLDMKTGRAAVESLGDRVEFPRVDPRRIGERARCLVSAASWIDRPARRNVLFHGVQLRDIESGMVDRYDYGAQAVVEEHIVVPRPGSRDERDAWLLGTVFDAQRRITLVSVLDARRVSAGPLAQAALPYRLPLGFHGNFTPA